MNRIVTSKWGWQILLRVIVPLCGLGLFVFIYEGFSNTPIQLQILCIGLLLGLSVLPPYKIEITRDQVTIKTIFRTYSRNLNMVNRIHIVANPYGNPLFFLHDPKGSYSPHLQFFGNYTELAKTLIEAAYLSSPNVQLDSKVLAKFGHPPYGIFDSKE